MIGVGAVSDPSCPTLPPPPGHVKWTGSRVGDVAAWIETILKDPSNVIGATFHEVIGGTSLLARVEYLTRKANTVGLPTCYRGVELFEPVATAASGPTAASATSMLLLGAAMLGTGITIGTILFKRHHPHVNPIRRSRRSRRQP